jgi:hypothetical protein
MAHRQFAPRRAIFRLPRRAAGGAPTTVTTADNGTDGDSTEKNKQLDQCEYFDTIQDADCDGTHKMPECDFVDLIADVVVEYMPKFIVICSADEMVGKATS